MDIPQVAIVCAARHYIAAHESAVTGKPVQFGEICAECGYVHSCRGRWMDTAAPIFDAAGIHPTVFRTCPE